jgi:hypothetical protein
MLSYSSGATNLGVTDLHIGLGIWWKMSSCEIAAANGLHRLRLTPIGFITESIVDQCHQLMSCWYCLCGPDSSETPATGSKHQQHEGRRLGNEDAVVEGDHRQPACAGAKVKLKTWGEVADLDAGECPAQRAARVRGACSAATTS